MLNQLFDCKFCSKLLHDPVLLPCGKTVCKIHTQEVANNECIFCTKLHHIPEDGLPVNEFVEKQLEMQLNRINFNFCHLTDCQILLEDLNQKINEVELIRNDKENFIYEYFSDITREVDLRRDTLIRDIEEYSNEIIEDINKLRQECLDSSSDQLKAAEEVFDACKLEINELKDKFESFEMYDKKFEEVLSKSKALQEKLELEINKYKFELQGNKSYWLESKKIKINEVFGSIAIFNYDLFNKFRKGSLILNLFQS